MAEFVGTETKEIKKVILSLKYLQKKMKRN